MNKKTKAACAMLLLAGGASTGLYALDARSADHQDAPATTQDPAADINDVFAFMDGNNYVLIMNVFPFASSTSTFSNAVDYVFHTSSGATYGAPTSNVDVICKFASQTSVQCWSGTDDYVTGDPSQPTTAPLTSASGKLKVFAGLINDPFFFNLQGFKDTVSAVEVAVDGGTLSYDSGCPLLGLPTATALQQTLADAGEDIPADTFATAKGLSIVVSLDKSLVTKGGNIVSVWGATTQGN